MKQLFKRTRVLLPLLALLAVPAMSFGQSGRSWSESWAFLSLIHSATGVFLCDW